jgi:hypothetical protein
LTTRVGGPITVPVVSTLSRLHKNETYPDLAAGFEIGVATVCRYVHEALAVLAAMAPTLAQGVQAAAEKAYVVLDGTLIRIDRVSAASRRDGPYYSGKAHAHGMNVQVLADPAGRLIWASPRYRAPPTTSAPPASAASSRA